LNKHEFGGEWTGLKLQSIAAYLNAFNTALSKNNWCTRVYIDAFSGTGQCDITINNEKVKIDGSAKIALDTNPPFHEFHFIDLKKRHTKAIKTLCESYQNCKTNVYQDDFNHALPQIISKLSNQHRGVIFIDPYGMHTDWKTLKTIADSKKLDVWYLFSLSGFFRQATVNERDLEEEKHQAIIRLLGDENYKSTLYKEPPIQDLFGYDQNKERGNWKDLCKYTTERLKTIFPLVLEPRIIYGDGKRPKFALYFAVSNTSKVAQGVAKNIASHILASG